MSARILLADDEQDILETVAYALRSASFEVECVADGEAALDAARSGRFDLLLLDVMMPKMSGLDVCRTVRAESNLPIIMLTAKDAELDRVVGLELGADDYVPKPFSMAELTSRVRALLRRRERDQAETVTSAISEIGGLRIDFTRHEVSVDGAVIALTPSQFKLLALFSGEPGRVFTRDQIMDHLWATPYVGATRACDVHISGLRRTIERDPSHPERIVTVRGIGYKLEPV